jgi:hypothetical protein
MIATVLAHRRLPIALAVLAPLLLLPALSAGWQLDDHFHRSRILGYGDANVVAPAVPAERASFCSDATARCGRHSRPYAVDAAEAIANHACFFFFCKAPLTIDRRPSGRARVDAT